MFTHARSAALPIAARSARNASSQIGGAVTREILTILTIKLEKLVDEIAAADAIIATDYLVNVAKIHWTCPHTWVF